ncbi:MAG: hypothetical protein KJI71_00580 [Patescibacteria group bacterium]|nr:hypothetical protein [Patescibacteria group bacterium]
MVEKEILIGLLNCSEKEFDYLKVLKVRFGEILPENHFIYFHESLKLTLVNMTIGCHYGEEKNHVNDLIIRMVGHIVKEKCGTLIDEDILYAVYDLAMEINFLNPKFQFDDLLLKEWLISNDTKKTIVNLSSKFLGKGVNEVT